VFTELAKRYAERHGGYTRIHKFGNRKGDNAPHAILELVDNPRDLKFDITTRAVGWELLANELKVKNPNTLASKGIDGLQGILQHECKLGPKDSGKLRPITRRNLQKVLKFRQQGMMEDFGKKAEEHVVCTCPHLFMIVISVNCGVGYPLGQAAGHQNPTRAYGKREIYHRARILP